MITVPQADPQLRFATIRLGTGPRVRYVEYGDPGGEVVVFLHGFTDSSHSFSRLLPLLAASRYHAYAYDQRGHGDSERPDGGYAVDDFAADVVAFLDAIGAARVTLVGHSMSTLIARRVAETSPERIARLVLIGSFVTLRGEAVRELSDAVRTLEDPVPPDFVREFQASTIHVRLPEPFFEQVVAESLKLPARVWRSVWDGLLRADDVERLGQIAAPTLILWGDRDAICSREDQEQLAAAIPGARLTAYRETGHDPHWERPEQVARDLDTFLREA